VISLKPNAKTVDFEIFRSALEAALAYADGVKGGRPPYDAVMMFKILVIQAQNNLSDERTEFLINDRLSFMPFLGLSLGVRVPDAKTIWLFRERLIRAGAIATLFDRFDQAVRAAGYIAMAGQMWMRAWSRRRSSATPMPRRRRSRLAASLRAGATSRQGCARRIAMHAGR
jgi:IS5 family transposase